eukprot:COSAG02_NODE_19754_length_866_cov_0.812256_2_plen_63_part_01
MSQPPRVQFNFEPDPIEIDTETGEEDPNFTYPEDVRDGSSDTEEQIVEEDILPERVQKPTQRE